MARTVTVVSSVRGIQKVKMTIIRIFTLVNPISYVAYKTSQHEPKMSFVEFTNDVISELVQGDRNAKHRDLSDLDKTPQENVLRPSFFYKDSSPR